MSHTIKVFEAAKALGVSTRFLQMGLQQGRFPMFGTAVQMSKSRWRYYINRERFQQYIGHITE